MVANSIYKVLIISNFAKHTSGLRNKNKNSNNTQVVMYNSSYKNESLPVCELLHGRESKGAWVDTREKVEAVVAGIKFFLSHVQDKT